MLIPKVDIPAHLDGSSSSGDFTEATCCEMLISHLSVLSHPLLEITNIDSSVENPITAEQARINRLKKVAATVPCMLDVSFLDSDQGLTQLLDAGLLVAFLPNNRPMADIKTSVEALPKSRVGIILTIESAEEATEAIQFFRGTFGNFLFKVTADDIAAGRLSAVVAAVTAAQSTAHHSMHAYFSFAMGDIDMDEAVKLATTNETTHVVIHPKIYTNAVVDPIICSPALLEAEMDLIKFDFLDAFIACLNTDRPDGMFTTVVCDDHGVCLGLVYSNKESIRAAFLERRGIYWSRSRRSLWRKGDSSGMYQQLLEMKYDCDGDALRFRVIQHGSPPAFCHLMTRTCWGPERGVQKLEHLLFDRRKSAPEGSYTKRLFEDPDLLRKKLLEEVQELVEATEPDHVAAEAADVMYFLMARCVAAGVGLTDIERHLDQRSLKISRRPGNSKSWRTSEAERLLAETKQPSAETEAVL